MVRRVERFDEPMIRDAVRIGLNFFSASRDYHPIPPRIKGLILALTMERFYGLPTGNHERIELVECLQAAVRPWRRELTLL